MRRTPWPWLLLLLTACASHPAPGVRERLADALPDAPVRLVLAGAEVVGIATSIDESALPALARTTVTAIAPDGRLSFCGREQGERGRGYRVEKDYDEPFPHRRSALVTSDGAVLERWHTLPLARVPEHVLATALSAGPFVDSAAIVSGPEREEYWRVLVRDRDGRVHVCRIALDGDLLQRRLRLQSVVDS